MGGRPAQVPLSLSGVVQRYRGFEALAGVSVEVGRGVTALIGVNGAGKTTLMTAVSGARRPSSGRVRIDGWDPYGLTERRHALPLVSYVPQSARFPGGMRAVEVVEYLAWMRGVPRRQVHARALDALDQVLLADRAKTKVKHLSGGMVRRLTLAQAIASAPSVLLLDEPSTGLDPQQRRTMVDLIARLDRDLDTTVLLSSHVMEDVSDVATRVLVLDAGRFVFDGTVGQLRELAPTGTDAGKAAEAGFLAVIGEAASVPGAVVP